MIVLAFFTWWYGSGWSGTTRGLSKRITKVGHSFSVDLLVQTLFSPWRRIISSPGSSLEDHFKAGIDNIVSRAVGFFVRLSVLVTAFFCMAVIAILSFIELIIWPLLPPAVLACIVLGVLR